MSKKALLIAEKPSLMRAIRDAVNVHGSKDDITYKAFAGHTMSLKMPEEYKPEWERMGTKIADLPMIPDPFAYKVTADKKDLFQDLKREVLSGKYDYVINACDAGREGQHIFWSFYETIGAPLPVKRLWSSDTTLDSLGKAMNALRDPSEPRLKHMTEASKLRAQFDWLIGMNASRAFSEQARAGIAVGRVMTPTLKLVVDRELEIKNFKAKTFYEVEATFEDYTGKYFSEADKGRFDSKAKADAFIKGLPGTGTITSVVSRKQVTRAPELFSLQTLQSEAGKRFGYTMQETLTIVQGLYDDGFLSYPRTDSSYVTKNTAATFPTLLKTVTHLKAVSTVASGILADTKTISAIQADKKYVDDRKVEDHDAILPTKQAPTRALSKQEENIYDLVSRRFLAIFLPPLIVEKSRIVTEAGTHAFITNGSILVQKGFSELYGFNPQDQVLPSVSKGENKAITETKLLTGKTTPPKRYTSSSLGDAMAAAGRFSESKAMKDILKESKGIGTPATRGNIVEKLVQRDWMSYKGKTKAIYASEAGISVIAALGDHDLVSVDLTAEWEDKLRNIEKGTLTAAAFEADMHAYINATIRNIETMTLTVISVTKTKGGVGETIGACPVCTKPVIVGKSVYFCEGYNPDDKAASCPFIIGKKIGGTAISKTEVKKIIAGKKTKPLAFKSKGGKAYTAQLHWDNTTKKLDRTFVNDAGTPRAASTNAPNDGSLRQDTYNWLQGSGKVGKDIWGHAVTEAEALALFSGQTLGPFTFKWKSGKSSKARIAYNKAANKVEFNFK